MEDELFDIDKFFSVIWKTIKRRYLIIILFLLLGLFASILYNNCLPKTYKSFSTLYSKPSLIYDGENNYYSSLANARQSRSFIQIASSRKVISKVINNLNLDKEMYNYDRLVKQIKIFVAGDSDVITIEYNDIDNEMAYKIVNEISTISLVEANNIMGANNIIIIDEAIKSENYECSKSIGILIIGIIIGTLVGFCIGFILDLISKKTKK